jgi:hypothetical protein
MSITVVGVISRVQSTDSHALVRAAVGHMMSQAWRVSAHAGSSLIGQKRQTCHAIRTGQLDENGSHKRAHDRHLMHARMLCINAPLQLSNKQRSEEEAPSKDRNKPILKHSRRRTQPCCRNRRLPPLLQATVKCKEYTLLHYLDTDSSWRKGAIYRNSGHRRWSKL